MDTDLDVLRDAQFQFLSDNKEALEGLEDVDLMIEARNIAGMRRDDFDMVMGGGWD